jgi:hypothetical protein
MSEKPLFNRSMRKAIAITFGLVVVVALLGVMVVAAYVVTQGPRVTMWTETVLPTGRVSEFSRSSWPQWSADEYIRVFMFLAIALVASAFSLYFWPSSLRLEEWKQLYCVTCGLSIAEHRSLRHLRACLARASQDAE